MQEQIQQLIAKQLGVPAGQVVVTVPEIESFGHYSTNLAMRLAKQEKKNPLELAKEFAEKLDPSQSSGRLKVFSRVEAVAPGFINLWLSEEFLADQFQKAIAGESKSNIGAGKTVIVEYSDTNIAKPMHVGHSRPTFIGDALANIYAAVGYKVVRWNYLGDWGTQFGKMIAAYKLWGDKKAIEQNPIEAMVALYVRFHEEMKTNPDLEKQGQEEFRKLEEGDAENRKLWEWFKDESLLEFDRTYKRLGITFDLKIGEAYYEDVVHSTVKELKEQGIAVPSEGGVIIHLEQFNLPVALIQKSDGASLYMTRDIAGLRHRLSKYKPDKILYVVGNEQALHFSQLFAIAKLVGLTSAELLHIKFGLVLGEDSKKLSTREGKTVQLKELIDKITDLAYGVVNEKNQQLDEKEKRQIAEIVGIGALKYNDLKENRVSDITFNWNQMLDFHGDSAPYLQYTVVRLLNIIRKAKVAEKTSVLKKIFGGKPATGDLSAVDDELKPVLMKKVLDYGDIVKLCAKTNLTSHLAKYLFELAKLSSQYYESVRILDDTNLARRNGRLLLINSVAQTLTAGLKLLGIAVPERI